MSVEKVRADSAEATPARTLGLRQILITLCATLATAVYAFTWNSVTVALPHMQGTFSATTDQVTWVMIAFVIGSAGMTAAVGWFSDRFGRRQLFLAAIMGYALTLLGCGTAASLTEAVAWRFGQGVCGAVLLPLGQTIAVSAFPANRHGQATSLWALGFVTANVVAPSISGLIVEHLGWPWIFYVPIPVAIGVFIASFVLVPHTERNRRPLDWTGFSMLIIGVSVLQLMLARSGREDWFESTEILVEAMIAGIALYVFIIHTVTTQRPFIDHTLFLDRNYSLGQVFIFLVGSVLFLPLLLLPLLLQQIGGYPAIDTGYLLLSRGVGSVIGLTIMSRVRDSYDPRPFLLAGLVLTSISAWAMSHWTVDIRAWDVVWTSFMHGIASSAVWAPLNTLVLSRLPRRLQDQGFAFFYLCFDVGSAIGTAAVIGLHTRLSQINRSVLIEHVTLFNETIRGGVYPELWSLSDASGLAAIEQEVARQATMIAYNNSFLVISLVLAALIPFTLLFRYRRNEHV